MVSSKKSKFGNLFLFLVCLNFFLLCSFLSQNYFARWFHNTPKDNENGELHRKSCGNYAEEGAQQISTEERGLTR